MSEISAPDTRLYACPAKNRPGTSKVVHLAIEGERHTICGVLAGQPVPGGLAAANCYGCNQALAPAPPLTPDTGPATAEQQVIRAAEEALLGPPLVYLQRCDTHTHVLMGYVPLLVAAVRGIPGRRWDKPNRQWLIPAAYTDELARRLCAAGAHVSVEPSAGP